MVINNKGSFSLMDSLKSFIEHKHIIMADTKFYLSSIHFKPIHDRSRISGECILIEQFLALQL